MPESFLELDVRSLAYGGDGVARDADGRTVFVRGGCPGDRVRARILDAKPRFARAEVSEVLAPSSQRVDPVCTYAGVCGGCHWQHVSYETQLQAKHDSVADALARIADHTDISVEQPVRAPRPLGYRNRIELTRGDGQLSLGYHGVDGAHLPVKTCELIAPGQRKSPGRLTGALRFLEGGGELGIERVGLRVSERDGGTAVDVWMRPGPLPRSFAGRALAESVGADGVSRVLVRPDRGPRAIRGVESLHGPERWIERMGGFVWGVSPPSFFQVNSEQAEALVSLVLEALAPEDGDEVLDAYCGVGTFTLPLAQTGAHVTAIESSRWALADLRENLDVAGLDATVVGGDAARELTSEDRFDKAVIDPPRSGLAPEAVEAVVAAGVGRLVYVSCDPATFSRDAKRLRDAGMRLSRVTPVDLFPQTYHVELVGVFDRTDR